MYVSGCAICFSGALRFPFVIVHHGSTRRPGHKSTEQTTLMAEFPVGKGEGLMLMCRHLLVEIAHRKRSAQHRRKMQEADEKLTHLL